MMSLQKEEETFVCKFVDNYNHELLTPKRTSMVLILDWICWFNWVPIRSSQNRESGAKMVHSPSRFLKPCVQVFVKKVSCGLLPLHYILERWTIKAKNHIIHGISGYVIQVKPQISSILMRK